MTLDPNHAPYCSFCGKSRFQCEFVLAGPCVYICNECIDLCVELAAEERKNPPFNLCWCHWCGASGVYYGPVPPCEVCGQAANMRGLMPGQTVDDLHPKYTVGV